MKESTLLHLYSVYDSHLYSSEEFEKDVMRIAYVFRMLAKYIRGGDCNLRLMLNHLVVLRNMFGPDFIAAAREYGQDRPEEENVLFDTCLHFLNMGPVNVINRNFYEELKNDVI